MALYRCGPTAVGSRASWAPSPTIDAKPFARPLSGTYDRIFNAFEKTNAFTCVKSSFDGKKIEEERLTGHGEVVVNRKMSSSLERADCALAAQAPSAEDEDFYREKILYSQARQLYPLQEDLADWINKTIGITYLTGENFLDVLDNGVELCQLAAVIHDKARAALDQGLIVGPVPVIRGRCWQRAARRSFFSRDNTENFLTFCRELGVHENLLFESDDLVLHNQPRQVILCLLEVARLATRFALEPPGLVQLETEIALEERDAALQTTLCSWQFRDEATETHQKVTKEQSTNTERDDSDAASTRSDDTAHSGDSDEPLRPTNELDKRVQLVTRLMERGCSCGAGRCNKLLKVKKVGEGRYNIAGRNVFIRLLKGRHMMVRVGGGWDTLEHFLSRHEPCQVRLVAARDNRLVLARAPPPPAPAPGASNDRSPDKTHKQRSMSGSVSPVDAKRSMSGSPVETKRPVSGSVSPVETKRPVSGSVSPVETKRPVSGSVSPVETKRSISGSVSPVDSKASSISGKASPVEKARRTSAGRAATTPQKPRPALSLPLQKAADAVPVRPRKQSTPTSAPTTPRTPSKDQRKSLPSISVNAPKKSRSMSLASPTDKKFCGTDRLNQAAKTRSVSAATTPTHVAAPKKTRSLSLATTPVEPKKTFANGYAKQTRSMSLAGAAPGAGLTQAAIEASIRASLAAGIDDCAKRPFLHIKAKYRSPPPREVPPR